MKAIAYYRYSTGNQKQVDNSEARQRDSVEKIIFSNGWDLVASFTDHATSGADDKPELIQLQKQISEGGLACDVICVDALSRLSRRGFTKIGIDLDWIEQAGILLSVAEQNNGTPFSLSEFDDDITLGVKTWINHRYVKDRSRESTNGMRVKFAKQELGWIGSAPVGYNLKRFVDKDKHSIIQANNDLAIVTEIFEAFLSGKSMYSCVEILSKASRYKKPSARQPERGSVLHILRNAIYAGIRTIGVRGVGKYNTVGLHNHKFVKQNTLIQCSDYYEYKADGFKPAITLAQFNKVQDMLDANQKKFKSFPSRRSHSYSGLLRCSTCKAALNASPFSYKGNKLVRYVCPNSTRSYNKVCHDGLKPKRKQVRDDEIEALISSRFSTFLTDESFHANNLRLIVDRLRSQSQSAKDWIENDSTIQIKRLDELVELFRETGSEHLKQSIRQQTQKINALKDKQKQSIEEDKLIKLCKSEMEQIGIQSGKFLYFGHLYEYALDLATYDDDEEREKWICQCSRAVVQMTLDSIEVMDSTGEGALFSTDLAKIMAIHGDVDLPIDAQIGILKNMGLDHIQVAFDMQKWRGKDRRVPISVDFVFSVAFIDGMGTYAVYNRNRIELIAPPRRKAKKDRL